MQLYIQQLLYPGKAVRIIRTHRTSRERSHERVAVPGQAVSQDKLCPGQAVSVSQDKLCPGTSRVPGQARRCEQVSHKVQGDRVRRRRAKRNYYQLRHLIARGERGSDSSDATLVLTAQKLYVQTVRTVKTIASQIASTLRITCPFNIQFLAKENMVKVSECNLRPAARFP